MTCATGCVVRGEHVAGCPGVDGEGRECPGCLPRAAEVGVLCPRCWGRLQSAVRTLPALIGHLFEMAEPSLSSPMGRFGGGGGRRSSGPRSLYPGALGAADDLVAMLASWCDQVAEALCVRVPVPSGLWVTEARTVVDPVTGVPFRSSREVAGVRRPEAADALVSWLAPRLEECARFVWVADMLADLGPASARASARWPVEEPERRVGDVPCPACGAVSLVVRPPRVVGAEEQVVCSRLECGRVMSAGDWARARAVLVARVSGSSVVAS